MPENKRSAIVAPMYVVSCSLAVPTDDDQIAVSRRKTIGFSLTEPKAARWICTSRAHAGH